MVSAVVGPLCHLGTSRSREEESASTGNHHHELQVSECVLLEAAKCRLVRKDRCPWKTLSGPAWARVSAPRRLSLALPCPASSAAHPGPDTVGELGGIMRGAKCLTAGFPGRKALRLANPHGVNTPTLADVALTDETLLMVDLGKTVQVWLS